MQSVIFGGTFNPFHIGHYQMLAALCDKPFISRVFLVPDRIPPHKELDVKISDGDRISICKIAADDFEKAELSLVEFEREGKSYTYDTVLCLKEKYPDDDFAVTVGFDMLKTLESWYKFDCLKDIVSFIAFNRDNDADFSAVADALRKKGVKITVFEEKIKNVSSTELRKSLKRELLPEKIYDYIMEKGLYNGRTN